MSCAGPHRDRGKSTLSSPDLCASACHLTCRATPYAQHSSLPDRSDKALKSLVGSHINTGVSDLRSSTLSPPMLVIFLLLTKIDSDECVPPAHTVFPQQGLQYLVNICEIEDDEIFKIATEYWNFLAGECLFISFSHKNKWHGVSLCLPFCVHAIPFKYFLQTSPESAC